MQPAKRVRVCRHGGEWHVKVERYAILDTRLVARKQRSTTDDHGSAEKTSIACY